MFLDCVRNSVFKEILHKYMKIMMQTLYQKAFNPVTPIQVFLDVRPSTIKYKVIY